MNYVSEAEYPVNHDPTWLCTSCNTIWSGDLHKCKVVNKVTIGILFRLTAAWIGVHYSKRERRTCINPVPFVTIWIATKGGRRP
jgi:hypothetical protein